jgi:hypothetical protein
VPRRYDDDGAYGRYDDEGPSPRDNVRPFPGRSPGSDAAAARLPSPPG